MPNLTADQMARVESVIAKVRNRAEEMEAEGQPFLAKRTRDYAEALADFAAGTRSAHEVLAQPGPRTGAVMAAAAFVKYYS